MTGELVSSRVADSDRLTTLSAILAVGYCRAIRQRFARRPIEALPRAPESVRSTAERRCYPALLET